MPETRYQIRSVIMMTKVMIHLLGDIIYRPLCAPNGMIAPGNGPDRN